MTKPEFASGPVEVGKSTIQVKYTLVRGEKSNEIVSECFGGLRALIATCRICWFRKSNRNLPMMVVQFQAFQVIVSGTHGNKASKRQFENYYSPPPLFLYDLTFIGL